MAAVSEFPPEVLDAVANRLQRAEPVDRCTGKIVAELRQQFPHLKPCDSDLAAAIARVGLERGFAVYISDEPV
jgi:hypothetical protein